MTEGMTPAKRAAVPISRRDVLERMPIEQVLDEIKRVRQEAREAASRERLAHSQWQNESADLNRKNAEVAFLKARLQDEL